MSDDGELTGTQDTSNNDECRSNIYYATKNKRMRRSRSVNPHGKNFVLNLTHFSCFNRSIQIFVLRGHRTFVCPTNRFCFNYIYL